MKGLLRFTILLFSLHLVLLGLMLWLGRIHPARGVIAYTRVDEQQDPHLLMIDAMTGLSLEISNSLGEGEGLARQARWSREGDRLAFWLYPQRGEILAYELRFPEQTSRNLGEGNGLLSLPIYGTNDMLGYSSFATGNGRFSIVTPEHPEGFEILENAQASQFSPDGRYLAYLAQFIPDEGETISSSNGNVLEIDLYTYNLETGEIHNWTRGLETIGSPQWSPDSQSIVFSSRQRNVGAIYLLNLETSSLEALPIQTSAASPPQWSPDGRYLTFVSTRWGNLEIAILDLQTLEIRNISNTLAYDIQPTWSPDSQRIVFVSRRNGQDDLYLYDLASDSLYRLSNTEENEADPAWRPYP